MKRFYMSCPQRCGKRMKTFKKDADGERIFYFCRNCGYRGIYFTEINAWSNEWPREIFDEAVQCGVFTKKGRPI